jgi:chemotaxis protein MotB
VGYASSALFDKENPFNPVNRRIDIVVLTKKAQAAIEGSQGAEPAKPAEGQNGVDPAKPVDPNALPADQQPVPAHELRERLNLFDDPLPKPAEPGSAAPAPAPAAPATAPAPAPKQ